MSAAGHRPSTKTGILVGLSLSYQRENLVARSLYAALGFVEGDEWADDEVVARRPV